MAVPAWSQLLVTNQRTVVEVRRNGGNEDVPLDVCFVAVPSFYSRPLGGPELISDTLDGKDQFKLRHWTVQGSS
jgi:hypothetical protein